MNNSLPGMIYGLALLTRTMICLLAAPRVQFPSALVTDELEHCRKELTKGSIKD